MRITSAFSRICCIYTHTTHIALFCSSAPVIMAFSGIILWTVNRPYNTPVLESSFWKRHAEQAQANLYKHKYELSTVRLDGWLVLSGWRLISNVYASPSELTHQPPLPPLPLPKTSDPNTHNHLHCKWTETHAQTQIHILYNKWQWEFCYTITHRISPRHCVWDCLCCARLGSEMGVCCELLLSVFFVYALNTPKPPHSKLPRWTQRRWLHARIIDIANVHTYTNTNAENYPCALFGFFAFCSDRNAWPWRASLCLPLCVSFEFARLRSRSFLRWCTTIACAGLAIRIMLSEMILISNTPTMGLVRACVLSVPPRKMVCAARFPNKYQNTLLVWQSWVKCVCVFCVFWGGTMRTEWATRRGWWHSIYHAVSLVDVRAIRNVSLIFSGFYVRVCLYLNGRQRRNGFRFLRHFAAKHVVDLVVVRVCGLWSRRKYRWLPCVAVRRVDEGIWSRE